MAFNNGTLKVLETFKDSMLPVMRKGEIEALDHIIEDVKVALSYPAPSGAVVEITDDLIKEFLSHIVNAVSYKAVEETAGSGFMAATFYVQAFASWLGKRRLTAPVPVAAPAPAGEVDRAK